MKKCFFSVLSVFFLLNNAVFAKIFFDKLDLNQNDELLYTVTNEATGISKYNALFKVKVKSETTDFYPECVSFFPEQVELINNSNILQIRNTYGTAQYDISNHSLKTVNTVEQIPEKPLPLLPYATSYDGTWFCFLRQTSFLTADLVVKNISSGYEYVLTKNSQMSYDKIPAKWSPEKNLLIYEKEDSVYFCNPTALQGNVEIDEKYRRIGRGSINSVEFASSKFIIYADDSLLYKINTKELYTVGLYSNILGKGTVIGRLPFKFNPKTDKFSSNSYANAFVIIQNKRLFSYMTVHKDSSDYMDVLYSRPYTDSNASLIDSEILWDKNSNPILWIKKLPYDSDKVRCSVYRISDIAAQVLEIEDSGDPFISPDGSKVGFFAGAAFYVYDINKWNRISSLQGERIVSAKWLNSRTIFVCGEKSIRMWDCINGDTDVIAISSVKSAYWSTEGSTIIIDNDTGNNYELLNETNTWKKIGLTAKRESSTQNGRFRAFTNTSVNCNFENVVYIRTLGKNPVTVPLYKESIKRKINPKKVSIIFDAYDNADGLAQIITTLKKFNVKGDFFINGEFIRRFPQETKQIVKNEYNCNSMFFSLTDLTENNFVMDEDFIRRGLARNEDEFYQCTESELSIFWHAPFYKTTEQIIEYGKNAGYTYIDLKTENLEQSDDNPFDVIQKYYTKAIKDGGGIIPVTVGFSSAYEKEFLYNHLDLLICALIDAGFELVGINEL